MDVDIIFQIFFGYSIMVIITAATTISMNNDQQNVTMDNSTNNNNNKENETIINRLTLAYGSLLDINCETDDDCIVKNSICNTNTKRCDCDFNAIHSRTLQCHRTQDCSAHFGNTICMFGTCRCRWGLKANGKCVDLDVPGINTQSLPDWAISLIAVAALLSGIYGGRSPFITQLSRQLLSILVLVIGRFATQNRGQNNNSNNSDQQQQQSSPSILIDELQSAMITFNQQTNDGEKNENNLNPQQQQQQQRKPSIIDELVSLAQQSQQQQSN
ncbi:hypothetical protein BLA29_003996 [Euroglyphus maynei]|uniref:EB domain-containing protein n=1 Tax=Euroglyphus maynei TaxID=6958 RepID=A0A1Y3AXT8_EURMA|nr:hypothetical protein BLA29_003996 [Euroglyphus maynei]